MCHNHKFIDKDDSRETRIDLKHTQPNSHNEANDKGIEIDDPRRMLAELKRRASLPGPMHFSDDPKNILGGLNQQRRDSIREPFKDCESYPDAFRSRLMMVPSSSLTTRGKIASNALIRQPTEVVHPSECFTQSEVYKTVVVSLEKEKVLSAVAVQLQHTDAQSEYIMNWTTHLFSASCNGYMTSQHKEYIVNRAVGKLDSIIRDTLAEESQYRIKEGQAKLPYRLVVSNIAAGADEHDVVEMFSEFAFGA